MLLLNTSWFLQLTLKIELFIANGANLFVWNSWKEWLGVHCKIKIEFLGKFIQNEWIGQCVRGEIPNAMGIGGPLHSE